jgi:hypothetical protein
VCCALLGCCGARTDQVRDEEEDVLVCLVVFDSYGLFGCAIALVGDPSFGRHAC